MQWSYSTCSIKEVGLSPISANSSEVARPEPTRAKSALHEDSEDVRGGGACLATGVPPFWAS